MLRRQTRKLLKGAVAIALGAGSGVAGCGESDAEAMIDVEPSGKADDADAELDPARCVGEAGKRLIIETAEYHERFATGDYNYDAFVGLGADIALGKAITAMQANYAKTLAGELDDLVREAEVIYQKDWATDWQTKNAGSHQIHVDAAEGLEKRGLKVSGFTDFVDPYDVGADRPYAPKIKVVDVAGKVIGGGEHLGFDGDDVIFKSGNGADPVRWTKKFFEENFRAIDIPNLGHMDYDALPDTFRSGNRKAASVVMKGLMTRLKEGGRISKAALMNIAGEVHDDWLAQNIEWGNKDVIDDPVRGQRFSKIQELAKKSPDPAIRAKAKAMVRLSTQAVASARKSVWRILHNFPSVVLRTGAAAITQQLAKEGAEKLAKAAAQMGTARALGLAAVGVLASPVGVAAGVAVTAAMTVADLREILNMFGLQWKVFGIYILGEADCFAVDAPNAVYLDEELGLRVRDVIGLDYPTGWTTGWTDATSCLPEDSEIVLQYDRNVHDFLLMFDPASNDYSTPEYEYLQHPKVCEFMTRLHDELEPRAATVTEVTCENGNAMIRFEHEPYVAGDGPRANALRVREDDVSYANVTGYTAAGDGFGELMTVEFTDGAPLPEGEPRATVVMLEGESISIEVDSEFLTAKLGEARQQIEENKEGDRIRGVLYDYWEPFQSAMPEIGDEVRACVSEKPQ